MECNQDQEEPVNSKSNHMESRDCSSAGLDAWIDGLEHVGAMGEMLLDTLCVFRNHGLFTDLGPVWTLMGQIGPCQTVSTLVTTVCTISGHVCHDILCEIGPEFHSKSTV